MAAILNRLGRYPTNDIKMSAKGSRIYPIIVSVNVFVSGKITKSSGTVINNWKPIKM